MCLRQRFKQLVKRILFRPVVQVPVYVPTLQCDLLRGRTALVTGGTSGIGKAIATAFANAGAQVIITGRNKQRLADVCQELGDRVRGFSLDLNQVEMFDQWVSRVGLFDILVNNAGVVDGSTFGDVKPDEYDRIVDTNLRGTYFFSQAVAKSWIAHGVKGNILNMCSTSSLRPADTPYPISKWGLRSMTIGFAKKLIPHGIVVNGLAPGLVSTERFCLDERLGIDNPGNPSGRLVTETEVANLAVVLVSGLSRMVVGDILYVGGGAGVVTFDDINLNSAVETSKCASGP